MKKGIIVINAYATLVSNVNQAARMKEEFEKSGVSADIIRNDCFLTGIDESEIKLYADGYDFCVYLDKDKYVSQMLEKAGLRLFNSHRAVCDCDDKMTTNILLAGHGITLPRTLGAPLCYTPEEGVKKSMLDKIESTLGYPLVAKESYGSLGRGVYKVDDRMQLEEISEKLKPVPHLFQQFIATSFGRDIRVIVIGGKVIAGMVRKSDGDFRSNIELGGKGEPVELSERIKEQSVRVAEILKLDYCGIDWLFGKDDEPVLCEVNSNAFFGGIESVTGVNVAKAYTDYIIQEIYGR